MNIFDLSFRPSRNRSHAFKLFSANKKESKIWIKNTAKALLFSDIVNSFESGINPSSASALIPTFDDFRLQVSAKKYGLNNIARKESIPPLRFLRSKYFSSYDFLSNNLKTSFKIDVDHDCNKLISNRTALREALVSWDKSDNLLAWNQLCLDTAAKSSSGPTVFARFFYYSNTAQFDSWALFDPLAIGSIYRVEKEKNLIKFLRNIGISSSNLKDFRKTYKHSSHLEKRALEAGLRGAVADIANFEVLSGISTSLFKNGKTPQELLDRAENLLEKNLEHLLVLGSRKAKLLGDIAAEIADQISSGINAHASEDGSNQSNFYADTTAYQVSPSVFDPSQVNPTIDRYWQPINGQSFLTPQWGEVTTFAIDTDELIAKDIIGPYQENGELNQLFVDQLSDIVNISLNLTPEQKLTAEFWEGGEGTFAPPGQLLDIAVDLIGKYNLNLKDAISACFSVASGLHDAAITAWDHKTRFNSVRPQTAINQYFYNEKLSDDSLGQDFITYLNNPPFAELSSGHSTFSATAFATLTHVLKSNTFGFKQIFQDSDSMYSPDGFDGLAGIATDITLNIDYLSEAAESAGASRRYGGIHFDEGDLIGQITGTKVAGIVSAKTKNLLQGISSEVHPSDLSALVFGTLDNDTLTGLPQSEPNQINQIYGYAGDDILMADGDLICHLYGGSGSDTFQLSSSKPALIRDYNSEDSISLSETFFSPGDSIPQLEWSYSSSSLFTDVSIDDRKLFSLDGGDWSQDNVSISTFV
jgi:hypothetical protein